ncbi:MAG: exodeoxyribonuclease V subunit alpha [Deltaproteobacteria bacterium]|nr:exodeoxyribonuclease V subunit alpha [Deltaproteobacteria bacterium]
MTEPIQITSLDQYFADFIKRIDCNPCEELWLAAALASNAVSRGDTCFAMASASGKGVLSTDQTSHYLEPSEALQWRTALERCDTVGAPGDYTPLVLDSSGRLYLYRSWEYERQVAEGILKRNRRLPVDMEKIHSDLNHFFPAADIKEDLQREAALKALTRSFSVITGGPGTGKTATVARILALFIMQSGNIQPDIALAAPTGKAAMRLRQSIQLAAERLNLSPEVILCLPNEVSTVHRLLGVKTNGGGFIHNRNNRLPCDILVVDEASMVDLPLMAHLFEALRDDARVILLGDRDQLASVEAGAVLADICVSQDNAAARYSSVTHLTRSYRFGHDSGIGELSRMINAGESDAAMGLLLSGGRDDLVWRSLPAGRSFEEAFSVSVRADYDRYLRADSPEKALSELESFRVLSPLRSGIYGVENLNKLCLTALGLRHNADEQYYSLMPVLVSGNNYELGLFNGDTGVVMEYKERLSVWFNGQDGGLRHLSPLRLPTHETGFAMTVHKSQGSEFDKLLLILPDRMSEGLSRELLYTAVTRARRQVEIWGREDVFRRTVERRTLRSSGLGDRLAGKE